MSHPALPPHTMEGTLESLWEGQEYPCPARPVPASYHLCLLPISWLPPHPVGGCSPILSVPAQCWALLWGEAHRRKSLAAWRWHLAATTQIGVGQGISGDILKQAWMMGCVYVCVCVCVCVCIYPSAGQEAHQDFCTPRSLCSQQQFSLWLGGFSCQKVLQQGCSLSQGRLSWS